MKLEEKDTSSGRDMRTYRCGHCGRVEDADYGVALWQALSDAREAAEAGSPRSNGGQTALMVNDVSFVAGPDGATVYVPAKDVALVTEGNHPAAQAEGIQFLRMEAGSAVFAVGSGTYTFRAP